MTYPASAYDPANIGDANVLPGQDKTFAEAEHSTQNIANDSSGSANGKAQITPVHTTDIDSSGNGKSSSQIELFLRGVVFRTLNLLDAEHCSIALIDKKTGELVTQVSSRVDHVDQARQSRFRLRQGIAGHVAATGNAFLCGDVNRTTQYVRLGHDRIASLMCAPLVHKKQVLGTITVTSPRYEAFNTEHLKLLEEIANLESVGLVQLYNSDASLRQSEKLTSLLKLNQIIISCSHRQTLIGRVLDWLHDNFTGSQSSLVIYGAKTSENAFYGHPLLATILLSQPLNQYPHGQVDFYSIEECPFISREYHPLLGAQGFKTLALTTIYHKRPDQVTGLMGVLLPEPPAAYELQDQELLEETTHRISEGLELTERFRHSQETRLSLNPLGEGIADPVIELTLDGRVYSWSEAAENLFGYSTEEIIGKLLDESENSSNDQDMFQQVSQGVTLANISMEKRHRDGHLLSLAVTLVPVTEDDGAVSRISLLVRDITENTRLRQEAALRNQEMTNLSDIALKLASTLDNTNLLTILKEHLSRVIDFEALFVATYNEIKNCFDVDLHYEGGIYFAPESWPLSDPVLTWLTENGRQFSMEHGENDDILNRFVGIAGNPPFSILVTPTKLEGQVNGFIAVATYQNQQFSQYHKQVMLIVAAQAAIAFEKARILRRSQQNAEHLTILRQVAKMTSSSLNLEDVLSNMISELRRHSRFDAADIQLFGVDGLRRYMVFNKRASSHALRSEVLAVDMNFHEIAEEIGSVKLVTDLQGDNPQHRYILELYRQRDLQTGVIVPLIYGEEYVGLLLLGSFQGYRYHEEDLSLISDVAAQSIGAIENAQLHEVVKHQVAQLEQQGRRERRLLQETAQERERLAAIFHNSSDGIIVIDEERNMLRLNPAMSGFIGAPVNVTDHKCTELLRCKDKEGHLLCETACPLRRVLEQGEPLLNLEVTLENNDRRRIVSGNWSVVQSASGGNNVVATMRDITSQREVEEMKSKFIYMVSHELRNPINVINGFTKMLADDRAGELNQLQREFVSSMLISVSQLKKLAEDILVLSRVDADRFTINFAPLDFKDFIIKVAKSMRPLIYARNIRLITTQMPDEECRVTGDEMRLTQCVGNLLENAIKFTPEGGTIIIELKNEGDHLKLSVTDSGIGIAPEHMSHIFERFYQVQDEETRRMRGAQLGSGLGLSITREIIERHNGRIWVESAIGKGTTFSFILPILK